MANVLIINEKPSVSMEFSRVLGVKQTEKHDGYIEGYSDFLDALYGLHGVLVI